MFYASIIAESFTYGKGMATDLLFQLCSTQLQTWLLLEHRERPCHPPDAQHKSKRDRKTNFQIQYLHITNAIGTQS